MCVCVCVCVCMWEREREKLCHFNDQVTGFLILFLTLFLSFRMECLFFFSHFSLTWSFYISFFSLFFPFCFLGLNPWHMEVPRLGVESEIQLPVYTTVTATQDLSHICILHHSSWQHWILGPLSEARDQTHILIDTSLVRYLWVTTGTPRMLS